MKKYIIELESILINIAHKKYKFFLFEYFTVSPQYEHIDKILKEINHFNDSMLTHTALKNKVIEYLDQFKIFNLYHYVFDLSLNHILKI